MALAALAGCGDGAGGSGDAAGDDAPGDGASARPLLRDVTAAAGLDVVQSGGGDALGKTTLLEVNGSGGALLDADGDGRLDLVLVQGTSADAWLAGATVEHPLFLSAGVVDGVPRFERAADTGLVMGGWPTGVTAGDVDRDGRTDLVVGGLGEDALFLNRGEPGGPVRFERHPLPGRAGPLDWTTSVALGDADGDGLLDLYLVRYLTLDPANPPIGDVGGVPCRYQGIPVLCGPHGLDPQPDVFLRGLAGPPWFEVATEAAGLADAPPAYGLGVLFADLDVDGDLDVYVANDSVDNGLFRNDGGGRFTEIGGPAGVAVDAAGHPQAGMGVATGDVDADGDLDLVVTNFSAEANALYRQDGPMSFREVSTRAGLALASRPLLGWGVTLADLDLDGHLDLATANGHVYPQADEAPDGGRYAQHLQVLPGRGDGGFGADLRPDPRTHRGRGLLRGDLDDDGDLDLVLLRLDDTPRLFLNTTDAPERALLVSLRGGEGAAEPFGATLALAWDGGARVVPRLSASGFQGQDDPRLHVSLPEGARLTSAVVHWPGGETEPLDVAELAPGRSVVVTRGRGVVAHQPLERLP